MGDENGMGWLGKNKQAGAGIMPAAYDDRATLDL